jgi:hypothetical protein
VAIYKTLETIQDKIDSKYNSHQENDDDDDDDDDDD